MSFVSLTSIDDIYAVTEPTLETSNSTELFGTGWLIFVCVDVRCVG